MNAVANGVTELENLAIDDFLLLVTNDFDFPVRSPTTLHVPESESRVGFGLAYHRAELVLNLLLDIVVKQCEIAAAEVQILASAEVARVEAADSQAKVRVRPPSAVHHLRGHNLVQPYRLLEGLRVQDTLALVHGLDVDVNEVVVGVKHCGHSLSVEHGLGLLGHPELDPV